MNGLFFLFYKIFSRIYRLSSSRNVFFIFSIRYLIKKSFLSSIHLFYFHLFYKIFVCLGSVKRAFAFYFSSLLQDICEFSVTVNTLHCLIFILTIRYLRTKIEIKPLLVFYLHLYYKIFDNRVSGL